MKPCWCKVILGLLVVVFAWLQVDWSAIALTVLGALIAILSLTGTCCCMGKCETKTKEKE